jgi:hypothetical protein
MKKINGIEYDIYKRMKKDAFKHHPKAIHLFERVKELNVDNEDLEYDEDYVLRLYDIYFEELDALQREMSYG